MGRVSSLKQQIDHQSFQKILANTLSEKLRPADLRRMLNELNQALGLTGPPRRGFGGGLRPPPLNSNWANLSHNAGLLRRSPRLSPRTPVLASALVNLTKQFALGGSDGFQVPESPRGHGKKVRTASMKS